MTVSSFWVFFFLEIIFWKRALFFNEGTSFLSGGGVEGALWGASALMEGFLKKIMEWGGVPPMFPTMGNPGSTCYYDRLHDFSVPVPRYYKNVNVNSFVPCTATLWNSLLIECFHLTCYLNGFKSRINRRLLTVGFF